MDYEMFAIRFKSGSDSIEIDRGEVGPGLAGLKAAKAWLTVVAGYEWEIAVDGTYDWVDTLNGMDNDDFDHLSPGQIKSLDQATSLFKQGNPFSRMRPAWKDRIQGIPALLLDAVGDAQQGMSAMIAEARSGKGQDYDVWRAGNGERDDIDTLDLQSGIELLERSKKYLTGEVAISYQKGTRTLKVNLPKLFHIDGLQGLLPYFKFYEYPEWNDTVSADTTWSSQDYLGMASTLEVFAKLGLGNKNQGGESTDHWYLSIPPREDSTYEVRLLRFGDTLFTDTLVATFTMHSATPCEFSYAKQYDRILDAQDETRMVLTPRQSSGNFTLASCRVAGGITEYVDWVDALIKGPIYFTDAAGQKTMETRDLQDIDEDNLETLQGKIVFRDATFGGILPEITNGNFWSTVSSIGKVEHRVKRTCTDYPDPFRCTKKLPDHPSDLDYLVYNLYWMDDAL
jgi:hypothetical protein